MRFKPSLAPIKSAVFPLVRKDGLEEKARSLYMGLRKNHVTQFDTKQSIGKRYARMDEAGTPFCFTIDHDTAETGGVTVRFRDTGAQERVALSQVPTFLADQLG